MTTSKMSFNNSSSSERDLLRQQQSRARRAQTCGNKDPPSPERLFSEPIKVSRPDDPICDVIRRTLGDYSQMRETIHTNPKFLIGVPRQPPTPSKPQGHRPVPAGPFPEVPKPPRSNLYNNGQHHRSSLGPTKTGHPSVSTQPSRSSSSACSSAASSAPMPHPMTAASACSTAPGFCGAAVPPRGDQAPLLPTPPDFPKMPVQPVRDKPRDRGAPAKIPLAGACGPGNQRLPNGMVLNGTVKNGSRPMQRSTGTKPKLQLKVDNHQQSKSNGNILDSILKEMIAPSPLTAIPTPRKDESKFTFPSFGNSQQSDGNAPPSCSTVAKPSAIRRLDISSPILPPANDKPGPPTNTGDVLDVDLEISDDSDDETNLGLQKTSTTPKGARSIGQAVLTDPPSPLAAMSQRSESSSSDSSDSSSESDTEGNSNKSPSHSDASEMDAKPESPKPSADWNLDRFIKKIPEMPLGLPEPIPVVEQSQSFDGAYFPLDKGMIGSEGSLKLVDEDDFSLVPDLIKDFSKEDILIPSPALDPLESIGDPAHEDEVFSKVIGDVDPLSRSLSPIPAAPMNRKKSLSVSPRPSTPSTPSSMLLLQASTTGKPEDNPKQNLVDKVLGKNGFQKVRLDDGIHTPKQKEVDAPKLDKSHGSRSSSHLGGHKEREPLPQSASLPKPKKSEVSSKSKKPSSEKKSSGEKKSSSKKADKASRDPKADGASKRSVSPGTPKRMPSPSPLLSAPKPPSRQNSTGSGSSRKEHGSAKPAKVSAIIAASTTPSSASSPLTSKATDKAADRKSLQKKDRPIHRKSPKSQQSTKIKSKAYVSDDSDSSSEAEPEIDVVGTASPFKTVYANSKDVVKPMLIDAASVESMTETINAVSTGAGTVRKACRSPTHKSRTHKSHSSKDREPVDDATAHRKISAVAERAGTLASLHAEDLAAKVASETPVHKKELVSKPAMPGIGIAPLTYRNGIPSLMVKLDLSLLSRIPKDPARGKENFEKPESRAPSRASLPKEASGSENKRPSTPAARELEVASKGKHKPPPAEPGKTPKQAADKKMMAAKKDVPSLAAPENKAVKRPAEDGDAKQSERKKMKKSSKSSSDLPVASPVPKKESLQKKQKEEKVKKEHKNKETSAVAPSSVKVAKTESKTESTAASKSSKNRGESPLPDKKKSISSPSVKRDKKPKTPGESGVRKENKMESREKDAPVPAKPQPKSEVAAERCRPAEREIGKPKSPSRSRSNSFSKAQNVKKNSESVAGPSQNSSGSTQRSKEPKHRTKERDSSREQELKRRKYDSVPTSQTSSTEGPKTSSDSIERNTNHDRILPVGDIADEPKVGGSHSRDWTAALEKVNADIELRPQNNHRQYLSLATTLKHEADREPDRMLQPMKYLRAVQLFLLAGMAMERENVLEFQVFRMYKNTLEIIRFVLNKFRMHQSSTLNGNVERKVAVLSFWCQSIICLKLFNMRRGDIHDYSKVIMEFQKSSSGQHLIQLMTSPHQPSPSNTSVAPTMLWNKTTGAPSPLSPLPSPAGSVGSVESVSSGYSSSEIGTQNKVCNNTFSASANLANPAGIPPHVPPQPVMVQVPLHIHSTMNKQLDNLSYLSSCHDFWEQGVSLITRGSIQDFFLGLDEACGKLTLHSSLNELVKYVMLGLHCLKEQT